MGAKCCCARDHGGNLEEAPRISFTELHRAMKMNYVPMPCIGDSETLYREDPSRSSASPSQPLSRKSATRDRLETHMNSVDTQMFFFLPAQTLVFLDWDDTLFPSNWLNRREVLLQSLSESEVPLFAGLQDGLSQLFKLATTLARVVIVTNSAEPWVSVSIKHFMPSLEPLMENIRVVYARSTRGGVDSEQRTETDDPQKWKEIAFHDELMRVYGCNGQMQAWKNVVSIGDQDCERDAVRAVVKKSRHHKACRVKTVKLREFPEIEDLVVQHRVICDALRLMIHCDGNLDVEIDQQDLQDGRSKVSNVIDR